MLMLSLVTEHSIGTSTSSSSRSIHFTSAINNVREKHHFICEYQSFCGFRLLAALKTTDTKPLQSPILSSTTDASRDDFLRASAGAGLMLLLSPGPALARGRATLEYSYDRYAPRIVAGGQFYANDFRKLVEKNDWAGIKSALQEPPKRSKEDKAKIDGGISERAAQAGQFSDSRVIVACDLFASAFSDNSISPKTKKMKEQVDILRQTVTEMNLVALEALGEVSSGGFFGIGAKKPTQAESAKKIRQLYIAGGNAWNKYIFTANEELPIQLKKLPYLS